MKNTIKKYGVSLETLFNEKNGEVGNVGDEDLQILRLGMGGSIVHTEGAYYDLYNRTGDLVLCDGEQVILIEVEEGKGLDEDLYVVANYDGSETISYKFTKEEFEIATFNN